MTRRQGGLSIAMVVVLLAILATGMLAAMALMRVGDRDADRNATLAQLNHARDAIEQFAATNHRLPCPAEPALDTGLEAMASASTCTAAADQGTLPWKTLGLNRADSIDAWGLKISYRVYTGNAGSLVQPEATNATLCGTDSSGSPTPGAGSSGNLCQAVGTPAIHTRYSGGSSYLNNKGFTLSDYTQNWPDVAYVLVSHGSTGLAAYTTSGVRRDMPVSPHELSNTRAAGPFYIDAFSGSDVEANTAAHFDDLLVYRRLPDLVTRIGLGPREWHDPAGPTIGSALFTAATLAAANPVAAPSANFGTVVATSTGNGGNLQAVTGASGTGMGAAGLFGGFLNNIDNNTITLQFEYDATQLGITLGDFGTNSISGSTYADRVQFVFKDSGGLQVASVIKSGCHADGGLASFALTAPAFRSVEVHPYASIDSTGTYQWLSFFLLDEVKACGSGAGSCTTSLSAPTNSCP